ncbi:hypothetical protein GCM10009840_29900 [Pseudolysinimonas kribbensis]|uniref:Pyridoxamine 5'-phosphate oxidase N-terminal domain-containing protein n=1 Tax=Pseudolysinimonas kribbensis TaxID=433641 RepID=A0ABQ6K6V0_9MICO|nr:pyridoxamine 5'-phosphate oxidase family protein [Pseudolysinimonas kribbensis]GMA96173.1 hypothetical protein GCM10025881_29970 [Pseudolysinimonas kribbensis]
MPDLTDIDRIVGGIRYLVLATADADGTPWATPVFFAPLGRDGVCWVSSADARHSRNIAKRTSVAITVFDSTVAIGHAEAAYFEADAAALPAGETGQALEALNARLPEPKRMTADDLLPVGPLTVYRATLRRRYLLVRGGNQEFRNVLDMTVEV